MPNLWSPHKKNLDLILYSIKFKLKSQIKGQRNYFPGGVLVFLHFIRALELEVVLVARYWIFSAFVGISGFYYISIQMEHNNR